MTRSKVSSNRFFKIFENGYRSMRENITLDVMFNNVSIQSLEFHSTDINGFDDKYKIIWIRNFTVIRSFIPKTYPLICFTILSVLDPEYHKFPMKVRQILIKINHRNEDYSHFVFNEQPIYATLHSPNIIPDFDSLDNYMRVKNGRQTFIYYTEVLTKRLPPPYQTNCKNYMERTSKVFIKS